MLIVLHNDTLLTVVAQSLPFAFITVGVTVHWFSFWRRLAGPVIQGLHFFFFCGSALAPLLTNSFLCALNIPKSSTNQTNPMNDTLFTLNDTLTQTPRRDPSDLNNTPSYPILDWYHDSHASQPLFNYTSREPFITTVENITEGKTYEFSTNNAMTNLPYSSEEMFRWPYTIVSTLQLLICVSILISVIFAGIPERSLPWRAHKNTPSHSKHLVPGDKLNVITVTTQDSLGQTLAVLFSAVHFCHANVETTNAALILPFAVSHFAMGKAASNYVALVYWVAVACGQAAGILLSRFVRLSQQLNVNVSLTCLSLAVLTSCSHLHHLVVWVLAAGIGLGTSTMFTGLMNLSNQYTEGNVSSHLVAVFMGSSAAGSMVGPAMRGWLFRRVDSVSLLYYLLV